MRFPARDNERNCGMSAIVSASAAGTGCPGAVMSTPERSSTRSDTARTRPGRTATKPPAGRALEPMWSCISVEEASLDSQCSRLDVWDKNKTIQCTETRMNEQEESIKASCCEG